MNATDLDAKLENFKLGIPHPIYLINQGVNAFLRAKPRPAAESSLASARASMIDSDSDDDDSMIHMMSLARSARP